MDNERAKPSGLSWFLLVAAVFILRSFSWFTAELWYDEVLTLQRFVLPHYYEGGILTLFRDYPIANNHLLANAITICWLNLTGDIFGEVLFRIPALLAGIGTIALVMFHWRKHLGDIPAALAGLMLAVSPVFTAYAYQLRGYSLAMLLATAAVSGILELANGKKNTGFILTALSGVLLPLVMPSNLVLAPVVCILSVALLREKSLAWKQCLLYQLPWCIGCCLGAAYYVTIFDQFKRAMAEPDGWNSSWLVLANVLLAFIVHALAWLIALIAAAWKATADERNQTKPAVKTALAGIIAMVLALAAACLAARADHAPFPRVFLIFLPVATFLLVRVSNGFSRYVNLHAAKIAVAIIVVGVVAERFSEALTDYQLKQGRIPDNLLQQYYRGAVDLREIAELKEFDLPKRFVITDAYDEMSLSLYMSLQRGQNQGHYGIVMGVNRLNGTVPPGMVPSGTLPEAVAVARNEKEAADMFAKAGIKLKQQPVMIYETQSGRRKLFATRKLNTQ